MNPADRVAKLLRETRGQPSEGDLRQMVEDVEREAREEALGDVEAAFIRTNIRGRKVSIPWALELVRALARERK